LYLDSRQDAADLSSGNRELLQTLALEASTVLENARLLEEERARQKLDEELRVAREIQQSLLPKRLPVEGWFRAAGSSVASRQVGGDYFDVIRIRDDCFATVVADVCGKGVSSALLASLIQGASLRGAETEEEIRSLLDRMNLFLLERTEGEKYATLFYSVLSADGTLRWSNAAHCEPILMRKEGTLVRLRASGMPVGMLEMATYGVSEEQLQPGDKLVVYSDGFPEARNAAGEFFEDKRLLGLIREHATLGCSELHDTLLGALRDFTGDAEQADDITLVVVEYTG
jgi:sigma-B regulation protein RsbU (phosphoserine phosphatase)